MDSIFSTVKTLNLTCVIFLGNLRQKVYKNNPHTLEALHIEIQNVI
jgi:hypothetical protein